MWLNAVGFLYMILLVFVSGCVLAWVCSVVSPIVHATTNMIPSPTQILATYTIEKVNNNYIDCFPGAVVGTGALRIATLKKWNTGRPAAHRCRMYKFLEQFLLLALKGEDAELMLCFKAPTIGVALWDCSCSG